MSAPDPYVNLGGDLLRARLIERGVKPRVAMHRRGLHVQKAHGRKREFAADGSHLQGCMIALMPTAEDAKRLALRGGEKAADLHLTLYFTGDDAAQWDDLAREDLVTSLSYLAMELEGPVTANIFGVAHWNGDSDTASWVWNVGDSKETENWRGLEQVHRTACWALEDMHRQPELPPQHTPWAAHICAAYTGDLTLVKMMESRLGPVTFDRIRVSFGDDDTDIPLVQEALTAAAAPYLRRNPNQHEIDSGWDWAAHQQDWKSAVNGALAEWHGIQVEWKTEIRRQIEAAGDSTTALAQLSVDTGPAAEALHRRMLNLAEQAGKAQQREAEQQGVTVPEWSLDTLVASVSARDVLRSVANLRASILGSRLVQSAKNRLALMFGSGESGADLAADVGDHLDELSDTAEAEGLGASMTAAQNAGRFAVLAVLDVGNYQASEALDKNSCKPCINIDGMDFATFREAREAYPPGAGYSKCQGGSRCRGTLVTTWDTVTAAAGTPDSAIMSGTEALIEEGAMPWHTVQGHSECTASEPWAVVKDSDGSVVGCHASKAKADKQLAALYAAESSGEMTTDLGAKPSEGTPKDKRLKENTKAKKYAADGTELPDDADASFYFESDPTVAPDLSQADTAPWRGPLTVEGIETGDGREFDAGALTWADLPLPLRWNIEDSHGGEARTKAVNVGNITKIWREASLIMGEGLLDLSDDNGKAVHSKVKGGFLRGVSVDVDSIKDADVELVWPAMPDGEGSEEMDVFDMLFASPEKTVFHKGRIRAATIVDIPAFAEAYIALLDEDGAVTAGGQPIGALRANRSPRPVFTGPVLRASGSSWAPPRSWFGDPKLSVPTPIVIDDEGRVYGHAAPWGTCHIGQAGVCVTPPREEDHPYFMTGEVLCEDGGRVSVGQITVGTGHAPISYGARAAGDHYDNTGFAVADITVGNDEHGIWVAGAIRPGADSARVHELRASGQVSGDWRRIGGALRLVGLLAVNTPGFPVPKLRTRILTGEQLALTASGVMQLSDRITEAELDQWAYARVMEIMSRRVHGKG